MIRIKTSIILLFLLVANSVGAQTVGLVLSGGGAKGLYHVGVIRALEQNNIPIDYVSGTSMGAIVGGMYAIGMTPDQMQELFLSSQIKNWLTGKMEAEYMYYFKQMQRNAGMITLRLDLKNRDRKPQIPSNLVSTAQLDMAFIDFFSGATVACGGDFNQLFIPFRCIASDAINRHEVVYRVGDVGKSIRTSMSIPLIFPPIENDSTLLYDGGIFNNFPWQVLEQDFTPDILIGSKCVTGRVEFNDTNILDQAFALTMMHTDYSLPADKGVEIERVFNDISMMDFNRSAYIMQCGYDDTMLQMDSIKMVISHRTDPAELAAKRAEFRAKMPDLVFDDYQITGLNSLQTNYVKKVLKINKQNPIYSYNQFKSEYFKLIADGEIDAAYPKVSYTDSTGLFRIALKMKIKPSFKVMLGGNISSTSLNQAYFGIEYRHIRNYVHTFNLDTYFSSFYSSVALGGRTDFFIGSPYYTEYRVLYNFYNYFRSNYGFLSKNNNISYSKFADMYGMWAIGRPLGRHSVVNLTGHIGEDDFDYFLDGSGENVDNYDNIDRTQLRFVGLKFEIERDKKNFMLYPTRGTFQNFHVNYIYGQEKFYSGSSDLLRNYGPLTRQWGTVRFTRQDFFSTPSVKWFSWGYLFDFVASTHPKMGNDYATNMTMPSFSPIPHSMVVYLKEFRSPSFVGLGVMPSFEVNDKLYMQLGAYAYMPEEYLEMKSDINRYFRYIFNASVVYQTFIGAASVSFTKYDISRNNWFCTFNFGHAIFNKRGLYY